MRSARKNKTTRLWDAVFVVVMVVSIAAASHFWITDQRGVMRLVYPAEAVVAGLVDSCSPGAPAWMADMLAWALWQGSSLTNQIAYVAPDGTRYHCENGRVNSILWSPPVSGDTRFRYASLTKLFTADAVLGLINHGRLRLDSTLRELFPALFPANDPRLRRVTVAMLLRHAAGFSRHETRDPLFDIYVDKPWCPYRMEQLSTLELDFDPGSKQVYSNMGYCILGQIIERVTGRSYRAFIAERYQLEQTTIRFVDGPLYADEVHYDFRNTGFFGPGYSHYFNWQALSAIAGLSGSASDLAKVIRGTLDHESLSLLSGWPSTSCDSKQSDRCYSFGPFRYMRKGWGKPFYIKEGYLPGAASTAFIDHHGGVTVLLTAGHPEADAPGWKQFYAKLHHALEGYYAKKHFD